MFGPVEPEVELLELDLLLQALYHHCGEDFRGFERERLLRLARGQLQKRGLPTLSALQQQVLHDPSCARQVRRAFSFAQVALFDTAACLRALRRHLVPWLASTPLPRLWLAECCRAEEAFILAIMLAEEGLLQRTRLFVTTHSEPLLEELQQGTLPLDQLAHHEDLYRAAGGLHSLADYGSISGNELVFADALRQSITWAQYSPASDTSFNEFQLIVCCRPLGDFGLFLRRRTLWLFHESLVPFGLLQLSPQDTLTDLSRAISYQPLQRDAGLYRRRG